jgi:YVTN family beta-propeller protein
VIEFRVLGSLEAVEGDRLLGLGRPQQRALLAVLLVHRGEVVSLDRLIDELWGEQAPPSAAKIVQGYVSNLRKVLGGGLLITRGHGYLLQTEAGQTDVDRFESLVAEGRSAFETGDARTAAERLRGALGLCRGPPFADFAFESFAQAEIARLEELRLTALEQCVDAELALGEHARLVAELEGLMREHPLRERFLAQLMLALYRSGRHADALESYRVARARLVEELGLEPSRELQQLEHSILAQDPVLEAPARESAREPAAIARIRQRHGLLITAGAAVLLAALVLGAVRLAGSGTSTVKVAPNAVAAIDTHSDRVVGVLGVGARPGAVAFGSGSLWVANVDDQTVSRVDPKTLQTLRTISIRDPPTGLAASAGGVWFVASNPTATFVSVSRIDPQFDTIGHTVRIGNVVPGSPGAIAAREQSVWAAPYSGELTRLDPQTGRVVQQVDPNAAPAGIDVGAGAIWVTDGIADTVTRVDPTGLLKAIPVGHGPSGIAVGDGGVWVADTGDDAVVRIDTDTQAPTATIAVGSSPLGVAVGAGSVWVANSGDGTVTRIDPRTGKVTATIVVGASPQAITVASGRAWVTVDAPTTPPGARTAPGSTARLVSDLGVDSMDPALAYDERSWRLLYTTCAKLLNYPDRAGLAGSQLVPEVAQSLPTRSADGKTYMFAIRSGFRFSPPSNAPVTAQTFKDTIERTLNPRMRSPIASEFGDIVGARAYMAHQAPHIAGVIAHGHTLTIRLSAPAPNLSERLAQSFFCAVPSNTPIDPAGVQVIPSAGPYRVTSYTPGREIVLTRNPNYHGSRPHRLAELDFRVGIPGPRAIAQVQTGTADLAVDGEVDSTDAARLAATYGPGSPATRSGHQQYFVSPAPTLDFFALNTHRRLFADVRLRRAVNYAIDRTALAHLGDPVAPLPEQPSDNYLPPGIPGYRNVHSYPLTPDLTKARALAKGHVGATVVLYTCAGSPCAEQAQIVKTDLGAIGLRVVVKAFQGPTLFTKLVTPGEPFDIAHAGWTADYPDPQGILNPLLENSNNGPRLTDAPFPARLAAAARLTGPRRYLTYARLDADLVRNAAPLVAYGNPPLHELFSARMGCQVYGFYGIDLAALCIRHHH